MRVYSLSLGLFWNPEFLLSDSEVPDGQATNIGVIKCWDVFFREVYQVCWCSAYICVCITGMYNLYKHNL